MREKTTKAIGGTNTLDLGVTDATKDAAVTKLQDEIKKRDQKAVDQQSKINK